jgi:anti-sigma regulatory factor (Ser/Thr protein kinase)
VRSFLREGAPVTYELVLAPTVESVGAGRRMVSAALSDWELEVLDYTATLLTSEVLTNSVLHARTPIRLTIERTPPGAVTISVRDGSSLVPRRRRHGGDATTGRGLELLDRLSQSWRVESDGDGKTIRFVVGGDIDPWAAYAGVDWKEAEL